MVDSEVKNLSIELSKCVPDEPSVTSLVDMQKCFMKTLDGKSIKGGKKSSGGKKKSTYNLFTKEAYEIPRYKKLITENGVGTGAKEVSKIWKEYKDRFNECYEEKEDAKACFAELSIS